MTRAPRAAFYENRVLAGRGIVVFHVFPSREFALMERLPYCVSVRSRIYLQYEMIPVDLIEGTYRCDRRLLLVLEWVGQSDLWCSRALRHHLGEVLVRYLPTKLSNIRYS